MKLITRDTDYAIRALRYIAAHKDSIVSVAELVDRLKIPRPFLRKLLQILNKEGLLESIKGQGGGFRLCCSARKIYLVDLMKIFQGDLTLNECRFKKLLCPNTKTCLLRKRLNRIEKYVIKELKSITLASLIGEADE
ncbi:MAG: Rrf2 family transcriptional regulator [Candidatus Omnitrophica bacterium]|nr:Rrf2 family transcriptional regulator [Candidatus Omnitrophota bacterium]HOX54687.1 Rrf2 family transcriptional regulator [Candidatus Omnitrophota bacterium]